MAADKDDPFGRVEGEPLQPECSSQGSQPKRDPRSWPALYQQRTHSPGRTGRRFHTLHYGGQIMPARLSYEDAALQDRGTVCLRSVSGGAPDGVRGGPGGIVLDAALVGGAHFLQWAGESALHPVGTESKPAWFSSRCRRVAAGSSHDHRN